MSAESDIYRKFQVALDRMAERGQQEVRDQGHVATGAGIASIEGVITRRNLELLVGAIMANDYMVEKVDPGVPASQVPTSGQARQKYINELLKWAQTVKPGMAINQRISFVYSTARVHAREGIPTKASKRFSKTGRRTGWISESQERREAQKEFESLTDLIQIFTRLFEQELGQ